MYAGFSRYSQVNHVIQVQSSDQNVARVRAAPQGRAAIRFVMDFAKVTGLEGIAYKRIGI